MALIDVQLPNYIAKALRLPQKSPGRQQLKVLKKLLKKARFTEFGQLYRFDEILMSRHPGKMFQQKVPIFDYNKIYSEWWFKTLKGNPDVCWPGKVKYYALSSGTSEAASKYIPITTDLLRGNRIVMIKQLLTLRTYTDINRKSLGKGWLMIGGSTDLQKGPGYYSGDLSGITAKKVPFWFSPFYKPGKKIARTKDWKIAGTVFGTAADSLRLRALLKPSCDMPPFQPDKRPGRNKGPSRRGQPSSHSGCKQSQCAERWHS